MTEPDLNPETIRALAAEIGLTRLTDTQLEQFARATRAARARRAALSFAQLAPADEPSHVYRLEKP